MSNYCPQVVAYNPPVTTDWKGASLAGHQVVLAMMKIMAMLSASTTYILRPRRNMNIPPRATLNLTHKLKEVARQIPSTWTRFNFRVLVGNISR